MVKSKAVKNKNTKPISKKAKSVGILKTYEKFSWKFIVPVILVVSVLGGLWVFKSRASSYPLKNFTILPYAVSGKYNVSAAICKSRTDKNIIFVVFGKVDDDTRTSAKPELVFARAGVRTGQITGTDKWDWLPMAYPFQSMQKGSWRKMGNRRSNDTVKVKYNGKQGAAKRWSSIVNCYS